MWDCRGEGGGGVGGAAKVAGLGRGEEGGYCSFRKLRDFELSKSALIVKTCMSERKEKIEVEEGRVGGGGGAEEGRRGYWTFLQWVFKVVDP